MNNNAGNRKTTIIIMAVILITVFIAIILWTSGVFEKKPEVLSHSDVISDLNEGNVEGIIFTSSYTVRVLRKGSEFSLDDFKKNENKSSYTATIDYRTDLAAFITDLYLSDNPPGAYPYVSLNNPNDGSFWSNIIPILSFVLIGVMAIFLIMSLKGGKGGNSAMTFGKTKARVSTGVKVRFTDVAGAEEEKEELAEIVEFLKAPKKFINLGAKIPKGVLLVGPPGTGKTLFAKAVAGEANVPFFSISGSDFVEMFVGVGASRVRDLFSQAKKSMPCILFIDEIDAVGRQRGAGLGGGNDEREQTLNQLLVEMDGFNENDGIIIIAATNRVDILDPALLRPGRFDRQVYVHIPDVKGREAIFRVHARNKPIAAGVDFRNLARLTSGFSGADIANLLNEAAILAARNNRSEIVMTDLLEGINKVIAGPQKKSRVITETDKRITAFHEAGHAIVGKLMKHCDSVQEVSIIPRGQAAGYTISLPKNDDSHITKNRLNDEIAMMLGGRAAEEIVIQDISTGASSDIKRATGIARKMVCEWGMSDELPNVFFGGDQEVFIGRDYQTQQSYGDNVATVIDEEIRKIIDRNYKRAFSVLQENMDIMENMVKLLFERETIYSDEVDMLMQRVPLDEINRYIDKKLEEIKKSDALFAPAHTVIVKESQPPENPPAPPAEQEAPSDTENDTQDTATVPVDTGTIPPPKEEEQGETE